MSSDGGPAFPGVEEVKTRRSAGHFGITEVDTRQVPRPGMSLRDYFAAAAMTGIYSGADHVEVKQIQHDAQLFYAIADAMLKERER